jgi:hypothetical protein
MRFLWQILERKWEASSRIETRERDFLLVITIPATALQTNPFLGSPELKRINVD